MIRLECGHSFSYSPKLRRPKRGHSLPYPHLDEAHRYRAKAVAQAVFELDPKLGLELTATPKTVGASPKDFKNVIYHYGLGNAMADGYVKEPAVATRADFNAKDYDADSLEKIMLTVRIITSM